jgi:SAM-dependent methyltransferase
MHYGISAREEEPAVIPLRGRTLPEIATAAVDLDDLNSPHTLAVLSVPPGATVLDIGCGPGVVAKALAARGCKVWGVEVDPRRADLARNYCVEVRESDVETVNLAAAFPGMAFDAVLFLDVLEHLRDPEAALAEAAAVLAPGGIVLLSIPNVTHGALRLELLSGKFRYRASGLLDRGHLRFFDAAGVDELIRQSGFRGETRLRVMRRLDQTEFDIDLESVPIAVRNTLEHDVDALTYQFFVIARPARGPQLVDEGLTLVERQRARMDELEAAIAQGAAYARHLEEQLAAKNARLLEIEGAVAGAERERVTSEARLQEAERVVANAAQELAARDQRLAEMEQVLADRTRNAEDAESYVRHLEAELRKRTGDIAIRDDEMSVLRTHIERAEKTIRARDQDLVDRDAIVSELRIHIQRAENTISARNREIVDRDAIVSELRLHSQRAENTISARDREIVDRDAVLRVLRARLDDAARSIDAREALLRSSQREVAKNQQLASHASWVLQHPRHRLADQSATALMRWMPRLHRLLRTLIVPALHDSPVSPGSPPHRGAD